MTRVVVNPGVCGKKVTIDVEKVSKHGVRVDITSDCKMVNEMGESLDEVDQWDVFKPPIDSPFYECALHCRLHAACPIPMAIIKAIEVETGLAVPGPVSLRFENVERG